VSAPNESARKGGAGGWTLERLAPVFGIVFSILLIVAHVMRGLTPGPDESPQEILEYFEDHRQVVLVSVYMLVIGNFFLIAFGGLLWRALRAVEREPAWLASVAFAGVILAGATSAIANAFYASAAFRADGSLAPHSAQTLLDMGERFRQQWSGLAIMLLAAGVVILRTNVFPRWLAWLGFGCVLLWLIAAFPSGDDANVSLQLFDVGGGVAIVGAVVWIVVVSLRIGRGERQRAPAGEPAPAASR
jgi:hypothetical protein